MKDDFEDINQIFLHNHQIVKGGEVLSLAYTSIKNLKLIEKGNTTKVIMYKQVLAFGILFDLRGKRRSPLTQIPFRIVIHQCI